MNNEERVTYFAETDARNKRVKFGIKAKDRSRHMYIIGKTGMGKSTLLENMAVQDIQNGEGIAFVDPHGKTADLLLEYVPEHRIKDVVYFAPFDLSHPVSFNVLEDVDPDKRHLVVSGLMSTFKKIWVDAWSARMEYILSNTLLALLEYPDSTLLGVNRMLSDKDYRKKVVDNIKDPSVRSFWVDEFAKYTERMAAEAIPAIQNKVGQFTSNPLIRNLIGQPKSSFNLRQCMDNKKILIVNLSKGRIGDTNANLIGGMMITKLYLAAMSRADMSDTAIKKLPYCYLFVDEFQNFANESFADILSEARKYKLSLTIAHQYIEQMEEEVRAAVFGNVGTMITFRVGAYDAEVLEKEYGPAFTAEDIVNLGFAQIYLKLMIDGVSSQPFSATTLGPIAKPEISYAKEVIDESRAQFAQPREIVEKAINEWHKPTVTAPPPRAQVAPSAQNSSQKPVQNGVQSKPQSSPTASSPIAKPAQVSTPISTQKPANFSAQSASPVSPMSSASPAYTSSPAKTATLQASNTTSNAPVKSNAPASAYKPVPAPKSENNGGSEGGEKKESFEPEKIKPISLSSLVANRSDSNISNMAHGTSNVASNGASVERNANTNGNAVNSGPVINITNGANHHAVVNNRKQASAQNMSELKKALQALTAKANASQTIDVAQPHIQPQTHSQSQLQPEPQQDPQVKVQVQPELQVESQPKVQPQPQVQKQEQSQLKVQPESQSQSQSQLQSKPQLQMGQEVSGAKTANAGRVNEQDLIDLFKVE